MSFRARLPQGRTKRTRELRWTVAAPVAVTCALGLLLAGRQAAGGDVPLDLERSVPSFQVEEYQPDVKWSGRVNTIAVHPTDPRRLTVASETGGLFQSDDGGESWRHLDGMPAWRTVAVAYYPADPQVLVATAGSDFKSPSGAGVWVSRDGGETWAKVSIANSPSNGACTTSTEAWDVTASSSGTILFVATDCGIAVTDNTTSWRRITSGDAGSPFRSVLHLNPSDLVAAGPAGVYYSTDLGRTWTRATGRMGSVSSYHALAVSPVDANRLYLIEDARAVPDSDRDRANDLYYSFDRGRSWIRGPSPRDGAAGCGGIPFVRTAALGSRAQLYAGNRCGVFRQAGGSWPEMATDHGDTRDLALVANQPTYLATDGGFHVWDSDARSWVAKGGSRRGLSALQVYEVTGQQIEGSILGFPPFFEPRRYDLYIGTQDNRLWSSDTSGSAWPYSRGAEGFRIDLVRSVPTAAGSTVVFTACSACWTRKSGANFRGETEFPDATRAPDRAYAMLDEGAFAQYGRFGRSSGSPSGLHFTEDFGEHWRIVTVFPEAPTSLPQFSGAPPVAYFAVRTGSDAQGRPVDALLRTSALRGGPPSACEDGGSRSSFLGCYPDMVGHRGLGRRDHTSGFATESVFAVDPADPMHLIAPDPRDDQIKESWDGGDSWQPIDGARALVTKNGALKSVVNPVDSWSSLISAVSFHPENATLVLMGGREGGIYFSHDRGRNWQHVPESERITNISSFHWKSHNEVFVSSYGRGLWRLRIAYAAPIESFAVACGDPCLLADVANPDPLPFDGRLDFDTAFLAYGGGVMDARAESGLLKSLALTPGTAWLLTAPKENKLVSAGAEARAQSKTGPSVPITETSEPGEFKGLETALALLKKGWLIRGFTLTDGKLKHMVVAREEAFVKGPGSLVPFKNTGKAESGVLKRPYLTAEYDATPGLLTIVGARFQPGQEVAVLLDGQPLKQPVRARLDDGGFSLHLRPQLGPGQHGVRASQTAGGKVVVAESTDFLVPSADAAEEKEE
jgi:photosystem II stability/assembly factor-like uncharacterized protein